MTYELRMDGEDFDTIMISSKSTKVLLKAGLIHKCYGDGDAPDLAGWG